VISWGFFSWTSGGGGGGALRAHRKGRKLVFWWKPGGVFLHLGNPSWGAGFREKKKRRKVGVSAWVGWRGKINSYAGQTGGGKKNWLVGGPDFFSKVDVKLGGGGGETPGPRVVPGPRNRRCLLFRLGNAEKKKTQKMGRSRGLGQKNHCVLENGRGISPQGRGGGRVWGGRREKQGPSNNNVRRGGFILVRPGGGRGDTGGARRIYW